MPLNDSSDPAKQWSFGLGNDALKHDTCWAERADDADRVALDTLRDPRDEPCGCPALGSAPGEQCGIRSRACYGPVLGNDTWPSAEYPADRTG